MIIRFRSPLRSVSAQPQNIVGFAFSAQGVTQPIVVTAILASDAYRDWKRRRDAYERAVLARFEPGTSVSGSRQQPAKRSVSSGLLAVFDRPHVRKYLAKVNHPLLANLRRRQEEKEAEELTALEPKESWFH